MSESLADISVDVVEGVKYRLTLAVQIEGPTSKYPALVRFVFEDEAGNALAADVGEGSGTAAFLKSDIFGDYRYIGKPDKAGPVEVDTVFATPTGCRRVKLELHLWRAQTVRVKRAMALAPADARDAEIISDMQIADRLIATSTHDVTGGESYDVLFAFSGSVALEDRNILMAVRFFDADGVRLEPPPNLPVSDLAGPFRYVTPGLVPMTGSASVAAPGRATQMQLRVLRWKHDADWALQDMRLVWLGAEDLVAAHGRLDLPQQAGDMAIHARVTATAGTGTLLGALQVIFEDASGTPLAAQAENMSRSDRFLNHVPIRPPLAHMMDEDGSFCISRHFTPPADAVHMGWRLLDPEGEWQLEMHGSPFVEPFLPDPQGRISALPDAARWCDPALEVSAVEAVQAAVPVSELWEAVALRQVHVLGEAICAVTPGDWYAVCGVLDAMPAQLLIAPQYFDADQQLLPDVVGPGCARSGRLPPARDAALHAQGDGTAQLRSCFQAPSGAAYGTFHLVASGERPDAPALSKLDVAAVTAETVCDGLDVATLSVPQLRAAVQLADLTGQPVVSRAARRALALLVPQQKTPAASTDFALEPLVAGWVPALGQGEVVADVPGRPLYVLEKKTGQDILATLAQRGQSPAIWAPPDCRVAGLPPEREAATPSKATPDGVSVTTHAGVQILHTVADGFDRAQMAPADRLTFDAAYAQIAVRLHGAGLVHAAGGMDEMLVARAVAQAQGLPLVCEIAALAQVADSTLAQLRHARLLECLCAADVVLAPAALHDKLRAEGVAQQALVALDAVEVAGSHIAAHALAHTHYTSRKGDS